jgi:class 3 adenylate cyclase
MKARWLPGLLRGRRGLRAPGVPGAPPEPPSPLGALEESTEVRPHVAPGRALAVVRGLPGAEGLRFPLRPHRTRIGRSAGCDVRIPEPGVSRLHAELVFEGSRLLLVARSRRNATLLNGLPVVDREPLADGDEIQLADRVVLRLERDPGARPLARPPTTLRERLEERLRSEREIDEAFRVTGSFLDVDVVGSFSLKERARRGADIVLSFERYRDFVRATVEEHGGEILNSNGDELMALFASAGAAIRAGSALLGRLPAWNARQNLLADPFRIRVGIHSGTSLVDRARGVAYSTVLDVAGHLQKAAPVDGMLVSEATLDELGRRDGFAPSGELARGGVKSFRWLGATGAPG